jgi:hypothetical protein
MKSLFLAGLIPGLCILDAAVKVGTRRPPAPAVYGLSGITNAAVIMIPCAVLAYMARGNKGRGQS